MIVPWWSFTKTVLAAAALKLVDIRKLALDRHLRLLLGHRAGLADYGLLAEYHAAVAVGQTPWSAAEMLRKIGPGEIPGEKFSYANIGYFHVAHLLQQAADQPLATLLQDLVFRPLQLTGIRLATTPHDLAATAWGNDQNYHPGWVYHHLLIGSAAAAGHFLHRLLAGALLPPALLAEMTTALKVENFRPGDRPWRNAGYGLGLMIGTGPEGRRYTGHTGGGPGSTIAVYAAEGRVAVAVAPVENPALVERLAMHACA